VETGNGSTKERDFGPDYEMDDFLVLSTPTQLKAVSNALRIQILGVLSETSATITQLSEAFSIPKGTINYHVKLLEREGIVKVVGERKTRAVTEYFYGRSAARIQLMLGQPDVASQDEMSFVLQVLRDAQAPDFGDDVPTMSMAHARVPAHRAREFAERLHLLAQEFKQSEETASTVYVFVGGVLISDRLVVERS